MPAPAPATHHGQQPVPVPAIRGQGSSAGMPAYPPKLAAWKTMAACEVETATLRGEKDDGGLWGRDGGLRGRVGAGRRSASWNGGAGGIGPSEEQRVEEEASGRGLCGSGEAGARRHDARELDAGSMGRR